MSLTSFVFKKIDDFFIDRSEIVLRSEHAQVERPNNKLGGSRPPQVQILEYTRGAGGAPPVFFEFAHWSVRVRDRILRPGVSMAAAEDLLREVLTRETMFWQGKPCFWMKK